MNSRIGDSEIACSLFVRGKGGQKGNLRSRRKARLVVTFLQPVCSVVRENRAAAGSVPLFAWGRSEGPDAGEDRIPGTGADGAAILRCFPVLRHSSASVRRPSACRRASRSRNVRSPRSSDGRSRGCRGLSEPCNKTVTMTGRSIAIERPVYSYYNQDRKVKFCQTCEVRL